MKIVTLTVNPTIEITFEIDQLIPGVKLRAREGVFLEGISLKHS